MLCKSDFLVVCVILIASVFCTENVEEIKSDELRQERNFDLDSYRGSSDDIKNEKWHAVEYRPEGASDWVPADGPSLAASDDTQEPLMKRRRPGRKRKRRPQNNPERQHYDDTASPLNTDDISDDRYPSRSRGKRPQRLDQRDDTSNWREEMLAEEPFRPLRNYNRRRLYPKYDEEIRDEKREEITDNKELTYSNDDEVSSRPYQNKKYKEQIEDTDDSKKSEEDINLENRKPSSYYNSEETLAETNVKAKDIVVERVRDPYTALNQESNRRRPYPKRKYIKPDEQQTTPSSTSVDIKALLKQSGGISLSELLQQKNLSLADLLKGEQHAISALTSIPEQTSESYDKYMQNDEPERKYSNYNRRLPPVRKYQRPNEDVNTSPTEYVLPKRVKDQQSYEAEPEITTERRIFVPSHPKYYTSVDYKPNMNELGSLQTNTDSINNSSSTEQPEQTSESVSIVSSTVTFSTSENPRIIKAKLKNRQRYTLPPTNLKLKNAKTTMKSIVNNDNDDYHQKIAPIPTKAIKIDLSELFGMPKLVNNIPLQSTTDGPMKISVNIEQIIEKTSANNNNNKNSITPSNDKNINVEQSTIEAQKIKELTAKDEIMEILSDSVSRENLTRLLELRNMTVEELVEQRERGSSQRHLADIFHNNTKEPEPTDEMIVDQIVKTNGNTFINPTNLFETFPAFDLRPDNEIQSTQYTRESRENQLTSKESNSDIFGKFVVPIWQQAYTNKNTNRGVVLPDKYMENDLIIKDETQRIEDIENKLAEAVNGALNIDVLNHKTFDDNNNNNILDDDDDDNEFFRLPYGVRSAIIASGIIVSISILVFLTIFIVFKWTQRQRKRLNYTNSFSSAKIKTPILETPYQRRIFSSIMNSTFGRKKRIPTISCTEPQSLQEYLWDNDRKPFQ